MNLLDDYFRECVPTRPGFVMEDAEREIIRRALCQFRGHRVRAAEFLGIGVRTLGTKIQKFDLFHCWLKAKVPA